MKKLVIPILLGILMFITVNASAADPIVNTCTSTFEIVGWAIQFSGSDTAAITFDTVPIIQVTKYAKNLRTGIEDDNSVNALQGDTIEFRITWSNVGGATADTVSLTDYLPSGLTYVAGSFSHTEANCVFKDSTDASGNIFYRVNTAVGSNSGSGELIFRAKVD